MEIVSILLCSIVQSMDSFTHWLRMLSEIPIITLTDLVGLKFLIVLCESDAIFFYRPHDVKTKCKIFHSIKPPVETAVLVIPWCFPTWQNELLIIIGPFIFCIAINMKRQQSDWIDLWLWLWILSQSAYCADCRLWRYITTFQMSDTTYFFINVKSS